MKLANNLLAAAAVAVSSEAMVMGVKAGLDPKVMLDVLNAGTGRNSATVGQVPTLDSARHFQLRLRDRFVLQGREAVHRRGGIARRADGVRRGGAADAGSHQRDVRRRIRILRPSAGWWNRGRAWKCAADAVSTFAEPIEYASAGRSSQCLTSPRC